MHPHRALVVLMGVAGSGKTTVGRPLAARLGVPFLDADDLHSAAGRAQMAAGAPLSDAQREPWLDAVHDALRAAHAAGRGLVVACSALRAQHRRRLDRGLPTVRFVHLQVDRATLARRLERRGAHFFPAKLLDSQLDTLEPLADDERGLQFDGQGEPGALALTIADAVLRSYP